MDDWTERYTTHLRRIPQLDDVWFSEAIERSRSGDEEARERLAGASLWIVLEVARGFEGFGGFSLGDLVEEGNAVVPRAVQEFQGGDCAAYCVYLKQRIRETLQGLVFPKAPG